jgi:SAM-dependent methyltransferase
MALIPALIAESHERGFVIGLGTGVTAGELAALEATRKVTVAEISRAVITANPLFAAGNLGASTHPKIELIRGDAFRTLLRSTERYDVIVSEPSNPWVAGIEMLYTREFLEAVRSRLAPGGVYGQWFHVYEADEEVVNLILRTYASVFSHVSLWYMTGPDLLVLGMDRPGRALDVRALESRFRQPDFAAGFGRVEIDRFPQLLAHELIPLGTLHAEHLEGPIHSLRRPILSDLAARAFFRGGPAALVDPYMSENHQKVSVENSLLRRYVGSDERLPEEIFDVAARETCRFNRGRDCASLIARWSVDYPDSDLWRATLSALRKTTRPRNMHLTAQPLARLRAFYSGRVIPREDPRPPHVEAMRVTSLFLNFYSHVLPFDRRVLEEVWGRCGGADCEAQRVRVEKLIWGLDGSASR